MSDYKPLDCSDMDDARDSEHIRDLKKQVRAQATELARVKEERDEYKKLVGERGGELMKEIAAKGLTYERDALKAQVAQLTQELEELRGARTHDP